VLKTKSKPRPKTRWTREFKFRAVARMDETADITALAKELGVEWKLLYIWRDKVRSGGAEALHPIGRPLDRDRAFETTCRPSSPAAIGDERRRIEELERKVGQQQLDLDFFRAALRHVRDQRPRKGDSGETPSTR
jgi:transposase-like protein